MAQLVLTSTSAQPHPRNVRVATPPTGTVIASGCSTTDPIFGGGGHGSAGLTDHARRATGVSTGFDCVKSTIPGSSMIWRKENVAVPVNAWDDAGNYDLLFIGDNPDNVTRNRFDIVLEWAEKMWATGGEMALWMPNSVIDRAVYPQQVAADLAVHEAWADYCNARLPAGAKRVRICPGGLAFRRIYEDTGAGLAPTPNFFNEMHAVMTKPDDNIHVNSLGSYLMRMMSAAFIWVLCDTDTVRKPEGRG